MKNSYLSFFKNIDSGFTLIELIAASIMTLFIVGAAGFSMMVMLREQTGSTIASDTQSNLNRAADFIKEEIQAADLVETGITLPSGCGSGTTTLRLRIPFTATTGTASGTSQPYFVYYSLRTPGSPWLGNRAIFRCGPSFTETGAIAVDSTTGSPELQSDVLVDLIALTRDPKDPGTCANGGTAYPTNTDVGFFVCLLNNKQVEVHLAASALDNTSGQLQWIDSNTNSRFNEKARYGVTTQAYARSKTPILLTNSTTSGGTFSAPSSSANATFVTSGCPTTFFPTTPSGSGIGIDGTTTKITANGTISVIISGTSLNLTPPTVSPALADFTFDASTSGGTFTSGTCTVVANLST